MSNEKKRIALSFGSGFVPGVNAVIEGVVVAGNKLGWEIIGLYDGFDGLLYPENYPEGGTIVVTSEIANGLSGGSGCLLGTSARTDPFHCRSIGTENAVEETDRSDELIGILKKLQIDAIITVVGNQSLSVLWKLSKKGLQVICIPKSVENDIAATQLSFGFNSALSFTASLLDTAFQAARSSSKIGVVEVPGQHAGWLALQAGMAVCADAILIPEIPYDIKKVAAQIKNKKQKHRQYGLVVVAEGAKSIADMDPTPISARMDSLRASLSPLATGAEGPHIIDSSGSISLQVAKALQRLTDMETHLLVLGRLSQGGPPTVVDRQLGLGYGASAIRALQTDQKDVLVVFQPPDLKFISMADAINQFRTVPENSEFIRITRSLGISLGD